VSTRGRIGALLACAVAVLLVAWYAGTQNAATAPAPAAGAVRLGPDPGEDVAAYLARIPAELPPDGVAALALVQLTEQLPAGDAVAAVAGSSPVTAVLHAPIPRVQTALRFEPLEDGVAPQQALENAQARARQRAEADAARLTGRPGDVAAAEASLLAGPGCRCVLALVVRADRAGLAALAGRPEVRAVQAAPPGVSARELALSPLLPEQVGRADPPVDDGGVTTR
jgi:predicted outer membrane lipoprotein